jgi:hypothetical protein
LTSSGGTLLGTVDQVHNNGVTTTATSNQPILSINDKIEGISGNNILVGGFLQNELSLAGLNTEKWISASPGQSGDEEQSGGVPRQLPPSTKKPAGVYPGGLV